METFIQNLFLFGCVITLILGFLAAVSRSLYKLATSCPVDNRPHDWIFARTFPAKEVIVYSCSKCGKLKADKAPLEEIKKYENDRYHLEERLRNLK